MSQLPKLTSLPKPSGLPKPKFMPKVKTTSENVLPTKYIPSSQPSSSRVGFGTYKPVMKSNAVIANKPLKPVNRVLPPATLQQRGTKRPGTAVNEVKSKISRRTPVKVTTGKNVRRSLARKSTKLVPIKKPAPYDYKARFGLLQDKHRKTVEDFKELELRYAGSEELLNKLKEDLHVCTNDLTNTKKKLEEQVKTLDSQTKLYDEIKTQNTHLQSTLDIKTQNLDAANSKIEQLQNANDELLQRSDKLSMENLDQKSRIEAYEAEMTLNIKTMEHKNKLINEFDVLRRNLMNVIQDLKGNIRVFCRIRPTLSKENYRSSFAINYIDEKSIEISRKTKQPSQFSFDQVFSESSNQEDIFTELSQLIQSVLDGYNVCVFAYGQTGSGKTYTMEGGATHEERGMIPRAIELIFASIEKAKTINWTYSIRASFMEIYKEKVRDLLKKIQDKEIKSFEQISIPINTAEDLFRAMAISQKQRTTAATESNEHSSRSHSITTILIEGYNSERKEQTKSYLNLVDLAGSEKIQTIGTDRVDETKNINKSLSTLKHVIMSLKENKDHIPYRDSKLTYLLQSSLGGNSKTLMIVNITPLEDCFDESVYSLRFAANVNTCKVANIKKNKFRAVDPAKTPSH